MVIAGRGQLQPLDLPLLSSELADRVEFIGFSRDRAGRRFQHPVDPPAKVLAAILSGRRNLGLPEVDRIAHTPFFGPDGTLQRTAGYHAGARTLYLPTPGLVIPDIPDRLTAEDVTAAKALLFDELLVDFPFENKAARTGALALGLTIPCSPMIDGPRPLFAFDAPKERTGKGLLMEVTLVPFSGNGYTVTAAPTETREWHKQIVAALRPGPMAAIFDNVGSRIGSGALASAITAYPMFTSRLLGLHENVHIPLPAVWVCTGNNLKASGEIAERTVRIRINSRTTNPGRRTGAREGATWRHPNLRRWANEHRGEIIAAWLILVQAWIAAGRPEAVATPAMGGFESWMSVVGSILAFHGFDELLGDRDDSLTPSTTRAPTGKASSTPGWPRHTKASQPRPFSCCPWPRPRTWHPSIPTSALPGRSPREWATR